MLVIVVNYEDLRGNPAAVLKHIGIEFERHTGVRAPTTAMFPNMDRSAEQDYPEELVERMKKAIEEFAADEM